MVCFFILYIWFTVWICSVITPTLLVSILLFTARFHPKNAIHFILFVCDCIDNLVMTLRILSFFYSMARFRLNHVFIEIAVLKEKKIMAYAVIVTVSIFHLKKPNERCKASLWAFNVNLKKKSTLAGISQIFCLSAVFFLIPADNGAKR